MQQILRENEAARFGEDIERQLKVELAARHRHIFISTCSSSLYRLRSQLRMNAYAFRKAAVAAAAAASAPTATESYEKEIGFQDKRIRWPVVVYRAGRGTTQNRQFPPCSLTLTQTYLFCSHTTKL